MSTKTDNYQIGLNGIPAYNFTLSTDGAGSFLVQRGTLNSAGVVVPLQTILQVDQAGNVSGSFTAMMRNDYFTYNSTSVATLARDSVNGGKHIAINGKNELIPSAGLNIASSGTTAGTLYYTYVYMSGGVMIGEHSATVPVFDTNLGIMIKTGDSTRTCVGMWYCATNNQYNTTYFISYANRRWKRAAGGFTADRNWSSTTPTELDGAVRSQFCHWGDEFCQATMTGLHWSNTTGAWSIMYTALNAFTPTGKSSSQQQGTATNPTNAAFGDVLTPIRGVNFLTLLAAVANGGTMTANMSTQVLYRG